MARVKQQATYDSEAQRYTMWRNGRVRVTLYGFDDDPAQMAWAEGFAKGICDEYRGKAETFLCTGGDRTETGRRWGFLIGLGDESEEGEGTQEFWDWADIWLDDRLTGYDSGTAMERMRGEFAREWRDELDIPEGRKENVFIEVESLRVWEK